MFTSIHCTVAMSASEAVRPRVYYSHKQRNVFAAVAAQPTCILVVGVGMKEVNDAAGAREMLLLGKP